MRLEARWLRHAIIGATWITLGCSSTTGSKTADSGADSKHVDGAPASYSCIGSRDVDAGPMNTCIVGQTYCLMTRLMTHAGVDASASGTEGQCLPLAGCASTPTCACIQPQPLINCTCADNSLLVLSCDQI